MVDRTKAEKRAKKSLRVSFPYFSKYSRSLNSFIVLPIKYFDKLIIIQALFQASSCIYPTFDQKSYFSFDNNLWLGSE